MFSFYCKKIFIFLYNIKIHGFELFINQLLYKYILSFNATININNIIFILLLNK